MILLTFVTHKKKMTRPYVKNTLVVRFDDEQHKQKAKERAAYLGRSLNQHILYLLNKDLKLK